MYRKMFILWKTIKLLQMGYCDIFLLNLPLTLITHELLILKTRLK